MRHILLPVVLCAALAACSSGESGGNNSSDDSGTAASTQEPVDANLSEDAQNQAVPVSLPSPETLTAFPADMQGRWGMNANDCDPKQDYAAKGLMTISATGIAFYESRGKLGTLSQIAPGKIRATLDYSGEGQSWQKVSNLTLVDDRTLVREEQDPAMNQRYQRCNS